MNITKKTTQQRLKYLMKERNLKQVDILNKCKPYCHELNVKMNKSNLSQYLSGKVEPSQGKLIVLGMALNVSEAWLMGYDVPMERTSKNTNEHFGDKYDIEILNILSKLNDEGKKLVYDYIDTLIASKKYESTEQRNNLQTQKQA